MKLYSAGDRIQNGRYRVLSRSARAATYLGPRQSLLFAVTCAQGGGPLNLVTDAPCELPDRFFLRDRSLACDDATPPLSADCTFLSPLAPFRARSATLRKSASRLKRWLQSNAPEESLAYLLSPVGDGPDFKSVRGALRRRGRRAQEALLRGRLAQAASLMKGCGPGLTPSGDDFVAGMLYALHLVQNRPRRLATFIYRSARGQRAIVNEFLRMAHDGAAFEHLHRLARAMELGTAAAIAPAAAALSAMGATSGCDLAVGLVLTLEHVLNRDAALCAEASR